MDSINRVSEWASHFPFTSWSKETSHRLVSNFAATSNASSSYDEGESLWANANNLLKDEWTQNLPHASMTDYRTPLFTFEFNGKELGFYGMSPMYWTEMLAVRVVS